ncbi:exocyst complex component exo70 [Cryptotrichosporon argae]
MLDDDADLALLDQHLIKTNVLSQRMTTILAQLDSRLSRLDKTLAPLGIQKISAKAANIDAALAALSPDARAPRKASVSSTSSRQATGYTVDSPTTAQLPKPIHTRKLTAGSAAPGGAGGGGAGGLSPVVSAAPTRAASPADESAILMRGPDIMALTEYFTALDNVIDDLERMWKGFMEGRGGAREVGVKDLSRLVEVGFGGLVQLFLQLNKDGLGRTFEPEALVANGPPTPSNYFPSLSGLIPLSNKMAAIQNAQHARTSQVIEPILTDCVADLAAARGEWICRSYRSMIARAEEADEGGIWDTGTGGGKVAVLVGMWDALAIVVEAETLWITAVFSKQPPPDLLPMTLARPFNLLGSTLTPVINMLKRALSSHTFMALDLYASLARASGALEAALAKCFAMTHATADARELLAPLAAALGALRGLVLRSFPEMLVDIRAPARDAGTSAAIAETTHAVLAYLEGLPRFEKTVETLLRSSHAERSWLMGANEPPSSARNAAEEGGVVNLYVADVLGTLIIHLDQRARGMRRPIGPAFLLNNLSHIRNTTSSFNSDIIGPGAEDMLNKSFREAKASYISEFTNLTSLLLPQQSSRFTPMHPTGGERQALKDAASAFFDRLAELEHVCMQYPLSRQDVEMRERVGGEVAEIVGGGYKLFWGRCQGKGLEKYLRSTPDEVIRRINTLFR